MFLEKTKLKNVSTNDADWIRDLRFILIVAQKNYVLDAPLGDEPIAGAYADMASEHWDRKVERESYSRYDQHSDVTIENYSISRDDRTWFSWFGSRDHLDD